MKVNSENLYNYINDLATDEKVKFKVYYDDDYVTQIYWNGESFEWNTGTFTSEAFFNPLYDFEVIEEDKNIKRLPYYDYKEINVEKNRDKFIEKLLEKHDKRLNDYHDKINKIIDYINGGTND